MKVATTNGLIYFTLFWREGVIRTRLTETDRFVLAPNGYELTSCVPDACRTRSNEAADLASSSRPAAMVAKGTDEARILVVAPPEGLLLINTDVAKIFEK